MTRQRRHVRMPPDLTSLFDVLFIVIFACLIRAAGADHAVAAAMAPKPVRLVAPLDPASLHARALHQIDSALAAKAPVVVRVAAAGTITAIERGGTAIPLDVPLLEHAADPDIAVAYLGDRSRDLTICGVVAAHLGTPELAGDLVIVAPDHALDDLPHALYVGLHRDVDRCLADHRGLAVIVEPTEKAP